MPRSSGGSGRRSRPSPSTRLSDSDDRCRRSRRSARRSRRKLAKLVRGELDWIVMKAWRRTGRGGTRRPTALPATSALPRRRPGGGLSAVGGLPAQEVCPKASQALAIAAAFAILLVAATGLSIALALRADRASAPKPRIASGSRSTR